MGPYTAYFEIQECTIMREKIRSTQQQHAWKTQKFLTHFKQQFTCIAYYLQHKLWYSPKITDGNKNRTTFDKNPAD
jgi:amino acid permease